MKPASIRPMSPCLWFDSEAEDAMNFYVSVFPNSSMGVVTKYVEDGPGGKKKGDTLVATAHLNGIEFVGINGGPMFKFSEAVSFQIHCDTQDEIDYYWDALTSNGGQPGPCGWCKDRFGLSWQVTPKMLTEVLSGPDQAAARRATEAFMQMGKFDLAALQKAIEG